MGLLNKFKRKENIITNVDNKPQVEQKIFEAEFKNIDKDRLQVDFYDNKNTFKQFYDTTRLIVSNKPLTIEGERVYNCAVSWYGENDCQTLNEQTGEFESPRAKNYRGVLAQIDLNLLQTDPQYCSMVMKNLLNQTRVEKYLEAGLQENPEQPCGKYIGGISQTEKGYGKFFSIPIGQASHNSPLMVKRREEYKSKLDAKRQNHIDVNRAKIEKLQAEIDDMSK